MTRIALRVPQILLRLVSVRTPALVGRRGALFVGKPVLFLLSKASYLTQKVQLSSNEANPGVNTLVESNEAAFKSTQIFNNQYPDEDTSKPPLKVAISRKACQHLQKLMKEDGNADLAVRVSVESGGCHGFQYHLKLMDLHKDGVLKRSLNEVPLEELDPKQDLTDPELSIFVRDGAKVVLDSSSLLILRESKIDYVKELIGTSFKVIDSPYTKTACGCGSSFDVDFSKLEN